MDVELDWSMRTHSLYQWVVKYSRGVRLRSQSLSNQRSGCRVMRAGLVSKRRGLCPQSALTFDMVLSPGSMTL